MNPKLELSLSNTIDRFMKVVKVSERLPEFKSSCDVFYYNGKVIAVYANSVDVLDSAKKELELAGGILKAESSMSNGIINVEYEIFGIIVNLQLVDYIYDCQT